MKKLKSVKYKGFKLDFRESKSGKSKIIVASWQGRNIAVGKTKWDAFGNAKKEIDYAMRKVGRGLPKVI